MTTPFARETLPVSLEDEMRTAISLIAKMPILMVNAYQVKRRHFDNQTLYMHPLRPEEKTAETILSMLRPDRQYTKEEAQLLDCLLMLHAEHGGGNNSTFTCRVLTSSGTDAYSAYSSAVIHPLTTAFLMALFFQKPLS